MPQDLARKIFEKWFNNGEGIYSQDPYISNDEFGDKNPSQIMESAARYGWDACRKEVLRLLYHDDCYVDRKYVAVPNDIIEKIKSL